MVEGAGVVEAVAGAFLLRRRKDVGFLVRGTWAVVRMEVAEGFGARARADAARRDVMVAGPFVGRAEAVLDT